MLVPIRETWSRRRNVSETRAGHQSRWRRVLIGGRATAPPSLAWFGIQKFPCIGSTTPSERSALTAPAQHVHVACAVPSFENIEYFHDHVRIERMLFDGLPELVNGNLRPDLSRPGNGLSLKRANAKEFAA